MKNRSSLSQHKALSKDQARKEKKTLLQLPLLKSCIRKSCQKSESKAWGNLSSDWRIWCLHFYGSMQNQHRCVSWRTAASSGHPSSWHWPSDHHLTLCPFQPLPLTLALPPSPFLLSLFCLFLIVLFLFCSDRNSFLSKLQNIHDPF